MPKFICTKFAVVHVLHRLCEIVTLYHVATHSFKHGKLFFRFHALLGNLDAELLNHVDDALQKDAVAFRAVALVKEGFVDLDLIHIQRFEDAEGGVTGAEVIE